MNIVLYGGPEIGCKKGIMLTAQLEAANSKDTHTTCLSARRVAPVISVARAAVIACTLFCQLASPASACVVATASRSDTFTKILPSGDIALGSGVLMTIPGLIAVPGMAGEAARQAMAQLWQGREVELNISLAQDRWGRLSGTFGTSALSSPTGSPASVSDARPKPDMAAELLARGGYMLDPQLAPQGCLAGWRQAEARARQQQIGLWAKDSSSVINGNQPVTVEPGHLIAVTGRITSVGVRPSRTYLNFGPPGSGTVTASMRTAIWRNLTDKGHDAGTLKGRNVIIKGYIEKIGERWMLDMTHASAIDLE
jgi:hypothetical protein